MEADAILLPLPPNLPQKSETLNLVQSHGYSRIMAKFSDALFSHIAPKYSHIAADQLKSRIQRGLQQNFPSLRTPTHPTYAMMIQRAIGELGENEGSREEAISDFIKREYEDLPLAHSTFLQRYLGKLCDSGELVSSNGQYKISVRDGKVLKRKTKRGRGRRRRVEKKGLRAGLGIEWPEERDGSGGGVNEPNVGDGETELAAEEKEMVTKEKNKERLVGDRTGSELDYTNSDNGKEENARNVKECLGEKTERALYEDTGFQDKEEFKGKAALETKENFEQTPPLKRRSRGRPPKPKLNPDQQRHEDKQLQIQNNDNSPQSSLLQQGGKSKGRGRPRKTNQAAVPALETLSDQNLQSGNQVSCPSRETDGATLLQSKRPRRERRAPKCYELIQ